MSPHPTLPDGPRIAWYQTARFVPGSVGIRLAAAVLVAGALGIPRGAKAAVLFDLVFRESGSSTLVLSPEELAAPHFADVLLDTTGTQLQIALAAASLAFDLSHGLQADAAFGFWGILVAPGVEFAPLAAPLIDNTNGRIASFGGVIPPPVGPALPPGVYHLGTVIWDTSGTTPGTTTELRFTDGACAAVVGGSLVDCSIEILLLDVAGTIVVTPEPGTGALLALGLLATVAAAGLRRRG
jgi:hypothetical protein